MFLVGCSKTPTAAQTAPEPISAEPPKPPPPAIRAPTPYEKVVRAPDLPTAWRIAAPHMEDQPNEAGTGTLLLIAWSENKLTWKDSYIATNETTFGKVMKDADEERGKKMCVSGQLIQISVAKTDIGKFHAGLLMTDAGDIFNFYGLKSSGALVAQSRARFCGIVTGRYDYSNSGGGVSHAVKIVGMFDLPENR